MSSATTAPAALVRHARRGAEVRGFRDYYAVVLAELDRDLAELAADRDALVAAAWAACPDAAARERLRATIGGIDPTFWEDEA